MAKLRNTFYTHLQEHYSSRKYKEHVTLGCAERCLSNFGEDDLTRTEKRCMHTCFHKYYRYLAYSNSLYSYLTADGEMREAWDEAEREQNMGEEERTKAAVEALALKESQAKS